MTEAEWLGCADPEAMLHVVRGPDAFRLVTCGTLTMRFEVDVPGPTSRRKLRLLACGCARRVWDLLSDERSRALVEANEQFADGRFDERRLAAIWARAVAAYLALDPSQAAAPPSAHLAAGSVLGLSAWLDLSHVLDGAGEAVVSAWGEGHRQPERRARGGLIRDVVGNPFRPMPFPPAWRTQTAVELARQMYESRDFSAMPILADALQDAGCDDEQILAHCARPEPHVRGCFVVDRILGTG